MIKILSNVSFTQQRIDCSTDYNQNNASLVNLSHIDIYIGCVLNLSIRF